MIHEVKRFRHAARIIVAVLMIACMLISSAHAANSVTVGSITVQPGETGVTIPIKIENDVPLIAIIVPLIIREVSSGAYITSLQLQWSERLSPFPTSDVGVTLIRQVDGVCGVDGLGTILFSDQISHSVSAPVGLMMSWQRILGPDLPAGADVNGSLLLTVDIALPVGVFEIDVTCADPSNFLFFIDEFSNPISPTFQKGTITVVPPSHDFWISDCDGDNGLAPSNCANGRWWVAGETYVVNDETSAPDMVKSGVVNRLRTMVHNRGVNGNAGSDELCRVYAYYQPGASGLQWPASYWDAANWNVIEAFRIRDQQRKTPHQNDPIYIEHSVPNGSAIEFEWRWLIPAPEQYDVNHLCVGFVIHPLIEGEFAIDPMADRGLAPNFNNIAQVNLHYLNVNVNQNNALSESKSPVLNTRLRAYNTSDSSATIGVNVDGSQLPAGWTVDWSPTLPQVLMPDSFFAVDISVGAAMDAQHGDTAVVDFSSFDMSDSTNPLGGVKIVARIDNFQPAPILDLESYCSPGAPECWGQLADAPPENYPYAVLQWTVPVLDNTGLPEEPWFYYIARDTTPDLTMADIIDSVAMDATLLLPKFQYVDLHETCEQNFYYAVYAVDKANNVATKSNEITVYLSCVTGICDNPNLIASFDADIVDQIPDITLPGNPSGDYLELFETNGTILVRSTLGDLISNPVEIVKFDGGVGSPQMRTYPEQPISSDDLVVRWQSLVRSNNCFSSIVLRGSSSAIIASVEYRSSGEITYNSVGGIGPTIPVSSALDISNNFEIAVNFTLQTTSLTIDGAPIPGFQNVPFGQSSSDLYYVGFATVACDFGVDNISICSGPACPDLTPDILTLSGDQSIAPGEEIGSRMMAIVKNIGIADQVTATNIGFYLSNDAVITTSDQLLIGGIEDIEPIAAGGSGEISLSLGMRLPDDYPLGPAWLGMIVDLSGNIDECDETNNAYAIPVFIAERCPKLVVLANFNADAVDVEPDGTLPGDPVDDYLNVFLPQGYILVRDAMGDLTNKPIHIYKEGEVSGSPRLEINLPPDQRNHDSYLVRWRMLTEIVDGSEINAFLRGTGGVIAQVTYGSAGFIRYRVGASLLQTPIAFVINENQVFEITVDFPTQTTSLSIDGVPVPGFQDAAFVNNIPTLSRFAIEPGGLTEQSYGIDDVSICVLNCCVGTTGNVDGEGEVDIADLTLLIDHLFINFPILDCPAEGNVDGDPAGIVDIADLTFLIDHLFINFPPTAACQ